MGRIADWLGHAERALETRGGRRVFWMTVAAFFVGFGLIAVNRAEFPKRKTVARLHYDSPMQVGVQADVQAEYYSSEFRSFRRQAWGAVMEGMDPYDANRFNVRAYPPFFNLVFIPFALPWKLRGLGGTLFYTLSFALALASAWCLGRCFRNEAGGGLGRFALIFLLLLPMALNVMVRCETDMLVLGPVAAAMMLHAQKRRGFLAGALLGFAASFKVLPGLFGVYLACRRQWSVLAGMAAAGVLCTVLLPAAVFGPKRAVDLHRSWYRTVVAPYHARGAGAVIGNPARSSNQSLTAAIRRFLTPVPVRFTRRAAPRAMNVLSLPPGTVQALTRALQAIIGLALLALWLGVGRRDETPQAAATLFATVGPGILLLSEVSLTTHHVLLILPLAVLILRGAALGEPAARRRLWAVIVYAAGVVVLCVPPAKVFAPLLPVTVALLWVCVALAMRDRSEAGIHVGSVAVPHAGSAGYDSS